MNRLTKKDKDHIGGYTPNGTYDIGWKANAFEKLGQYEDIDEKIGITYPILIESLLNGFDTKYNWRVSPYSIEIDLKLKCFIDLSDGEHYYFEDYGKTWALTREKLEDEK